MNKQFLIIGLICCCFVILANSNGKEASSFKISGNYYTCIRSEIFGNVYTEHYFHDDSTVVSMSIISGPEITYYEVIGNSVFFYTDYWQSPPYEILIASQDSIVVKNETELITYHRLNECVDYRIDYDTDGWIDLHEFFSNRLNKYCQNKSD